MMDNLHTVIRSIRGETKAARRDHFTVFREFLQNLERAQRKPRKIAPKGKGVKRGR